MSKYMLRIKPIELTRKRRKEESEKATDTEISILKRLAGTIKFLGSGALPQASYTASWKQQNIAQLRVGNLIEANNCIKV